MENKYHFFIHPNVSLGENSTVGLWVILGEPPRGIASGELPLVIGGGAVIRSHSVIYAGSVVGSRFAAGHGALMRERVIAGDDVSIGSGTEIEQDVHIGSDVRVHSHCFIAEGTKIGDGVRIAPGVHIGSDRHPLLPPEKKRRQGPAIEARVYIGMAALILPDIVIGSGSFIAAGAVVTKNVPPDSCVRGSPACVVSSVAEYRSRLERRAP